MKPLTPHLRRTSKLVAALSLAWLQSLVACDGGETSSGAGGTMASGGGSLAAGGSSTAGAKSSGGDDSSAVGGAGGLGGLGGIPAGGRGGMPAAGSGGSSGAGTFRVEAGKLYDRCREQVVLRGVNEMIVWSPGQDGIPEFAEIAKTGANAVRIVWNEEGSAAGLDVAITNALAQQLIPIIEHHGATGDLAKLVGVVDYWVKPDVVAVVRKHEQNLLLNIANEAGDGMVTAVTFQAAYQPAITRLREAGLVLPLVIDAPSWGQNIDVLQATWQPLTMHDPQHNLLFSVHMWWSDPIGTRVKAELAESTAAGMPLIVGEFAQHAVSGCGSQPFAHGVLLEEAQKSGIGWLAWSWGSVPNSDCKNDGSFDMTVDGVYGSWKESWAEEVVVTHPASIQKTSVRPASIVGGACR
jgi:mannan endo-1,4-beta-mannosidase